MQIYFSNPCPPAAPLRRASRWPPLKGQPGSKTVIWRRGCGDAAAAAAVAVVVAAAAVAAAASRRPLPPPAKSETLSSCTINFSNIFTCLVRNHAYRRLSTPSSVVWRLRLRLLLPRPRRLRRGRPLEERLPAAEEVRRDWSRGIQPWSPSLLNEEEEGEADCLMEGGALWITPPKKELLMMTTTRLYADCRPKNGPRKKTKHN